MQSRVVRKKDSLWRIWSDKGELDQEEQNELKEYFEKIRMPYQYDADMICVPGTVSWETIYERLQHFYVGRAEVYPF